MITAPTPIIMPSIVSDERNLLANKDLMAITNDSTNFTVNLPYNQWLRRFHPLISDYLTIQKPDNALCLLGDIHLMCNHHHCNAILMKLQKNR